MHKIQSEYSIGEELFHAISHGAGVILSIAGLSWMLYVSIEAADPWRISASTVYGVSLIALFLASPFLLVAMRTTTGWWLFGAIWTLATAGVLTKLWFRDRFPRLALAGYLVMGWLVVIALPQVVDAIGPGGMVWMVAGGLSYTIGAAFYAAKRITFGHAIWHVFVLLGGICHFLAVIWHVLPVSADLPVSG